MDAEVAEILGICVGDGCISVTKRYSEFALSGDMKEERAYYDNWVMPLLNKKIFLPVLGKELKAKEYPKLGTYGVITFEKRVVERLLQLGLQPSPKKDHGVPEQIKQGNHLSKKRFLRGLFDTDGSMVFEKNYSVKSERHIRPKILFGGVSKRLIYDCIGICKELDFTPRIRNPWKGKRDKRNVYGFAIYRKMEIKRWLEEIGFKSPKHTTKIAIWEKTGGCPPFTKIDQRLKMIEQMVSPSARLKVNLSVESSERNSMKKRNPVR